MFPRHVRWYRLFLLLLVLVGLNSDKAIAKTEGNLNFDSGQVIIVTCPDASATPHPCGTDIPEIPAQFLNSISDGDAAAFEALGGSYTGTLEGQLIILGLELSSGVMGDCQFGEHHFIIYDDANMDNILESSEFVESCNIVYEVGTPVGPSVDCSVVEDLTIDCNTFIPTGTSLTDYIDGELDQTGIEILGISTGSGTLSISNNFLFTGSGMNTDIIYTGFTGSGSNPDAVFITGSGSSQDIVYTVSDMNGVIGSCTQMVTLDIEDIDMSITCGLGAVIISNGTGSIAASTLVSSVTDACHSSGPYTYEIACETTGPCGNPNDILFSASKDFCCAQLGTSVNLILRVTDVNGNTATCNSIVTVQGENNNNNTDLVIGCLEQDVHIVDGAGSLEASSFVTTITDACDGSGPYTYEIACQTSGPCNDPTDILFSDSKDFCCDQIGTSVNVIVRVTDDNGNSATCLSSVSVESDLGNLDLAIVCEAQTVMLLANGSGTVNATSFVTDITDACDGSGPYTYEVAYQATGLCGNANDVVFAPTQDFCCAQTGSSVNMIVRVTDSNGNSATCLSSVAVT